MIVDVAERYGAYVVALVGQFVHVEIVENVAQVFRLNAQRIETFVHHGIDQRVVVVVVGQRNPFVVGCGGGFVLQLDVVEIRIVDIKIGQGNRHIVAHDAGNGVGSALGIVRPVVGWRANAYACTRWCEVCCYIYRIRYQRNETVRVVLTLRYEYDAQRVVIQHGTFAHRECFLQVFAGRHMVRQTRSRYRVAVNGYDGAVRIGSVVRNDVERLVFAGFGVVAQVQHECGGFARRNVLLEVFVHGDGRYFQLHGGCVNHFRFVIFPVYGRVFAFVGTTCSAAACAEHECRERLFHFDTVFVGCAGTQAGTAYAIFFVGRFPTVVLVQHVNRQVVVVARFGQDETFGVRSLHVVGKFAALYHARVFFECEFSCTASGTQHKVVRNDGAYCDVE